jgi:hypothetical protein
MREIYTSPRQHNIDAVVALMAEHGIETSVTNRSNYNKSSWSRFSYSEGPEARESWAQVWITRADDYAEARTVMRQIGIEPIVRFGDELAASRDPSRHSTRSSVPNRVRRILLVAVVLVFAVQMLRSFHII